MILDVLLPQLMSVRLSPLRLLILKQLIVIEGRVLWRLHHLSAHRISVLTESGAIVAQAIELSAFDWCCTPKPPRLCHPARPVHHPKPASIRLDSLSLQAGIIAWDALRLRKRVLPFPGATASSNETSETIHSVITNPRTADQQADSPTPPAITLITPQNQSGVVMCNYWGGERLPKGRRDGVERGAQRRCVYRLRV